MWSSWETLTMTECKGTAVHNPAEIKVTMPTLNDLHFHNYVESGREIPLVLRCDGLFPSHEHPGYHYVFHKPWINIIISTYRALQGSGAT